MLVANGQFHNNRIRLFSHDGKVHIWILIRDAHFELKFKIRKKDSVYAKSRRKT